MIGNSLQRLHVLHSRAMRTAFDRVTLPRYSTSYLYLPLDVRRQFFSQLSTFKHNSLLDDLWGGHTPEQNSPVTPETMQCGQPYVIPTDTASEYWGVVGTSDAAQALIAYESSQTVSSANLGIVDTEHLMLRLGARAIFPLLQAQHPVHS